MTEPLCQPAGRLEHPNIVTVYDAGEAEGLFYLTMQFVKGKTLEQFIRDRTLLPVKQVLLLMEQVCEGLYYAHSRGIVHRDLKPSNIVVAPDGPAKIVDFGIAKLLKPFSATAATESFTETHAAAGTLPYMAPEQLRGEGVIIVATSGRPESSSTR